ncbi:PREDICTED: uncharacterized protein LOC109337624 [Lupinus angustifolius]|uniref:uncharacterized protein LOC109337624 n=1 Tax=Lupinus angustifolius TaxID=3871 RepID=UPI00092E61F6|nr:PREDICTED: uncharacterized protein LOC109337624 [Lupinus angustifolius]
MKNSSKQCPPNSFSKLNFLSYVLILGFGVTIGIVISSHPKHSNINLQFTQLSQNSSEKMPLLSPPLLPPIPPPIAEPLPIAVPKISNVGHIRLKEFTEPPYVMHDMSDEELLWRASMTPKIDKYPYDRVPKVAFMFLVRGPLPLAPLWEMFFKGHEGYYSIYVHSDPSYIAPNQESPVFQGRRVPSKIVEWGKVNMIEAERRLLANALLDFSNQRFVLLSESCIPLFNFHTIYSYLINSTQNYVMAFDDPGSVGRGRYPKLMNPSITLKQWRKGFQWFEMGRDLALEVVSDTTYFPIFQKYCLGSCYADEHYLPTFVSIKFWERNSNKSVTWVDWSKGGQHPTKYVRPEVTVEFLENLRNKKCQYNGGNINVCFLFARKFLPSSLTRLMIFAPKVMHF